MNKNDILRLTLVLVLTVAVFVGAMFALNLHTGPLIEANQKGAEFGPLLSVLPEGASFDSEAMIYSAEDPASSALAGIPEQVVAIYREQSGMGYAVRCTAVSQYSKSPMEITLGVTAEGNITGLQVDSYSDSISFMEKDPEYIATYLGKDSALADVGTVSGATFSSTAFKDSVSAGLSALIENGLIAEGVKSDAQLLAEMIPEYFPGMTLDGMLKADAVEPAGNIQSGFAAQNGAGYAYVMSEGDSSFLALVNAQGVCKLVDVEGSDVTAAHGALADEAARTVSGNPYADAAADKFSKMIDGAEVTPLDLDTYSTVVAACKIVSEDCPYYGFYARSFGFDVMDVYIILNENGEIVATDAKTFIFEEEYFASFAGMDKTGYKEGFVGLTKDTFDGSQAMIATATLSSNAMRQATDDAFAAFDIIRAQEDPA